MRASRRFVPLVAGLLGATALLAAACGGGAATSDAPDDVSTPTPEHEATSTAAAPAVTSTAEVAVAPRDDGLTGAPVPPPTARSVDFDADLVDERAGAFPPLDYPAVVPAGEAAWMDGDDLVLGAVQNGEARAYPIFMLRFHHVANDELGGEPYLVTF
jgi:hypothetical protein